MEQAVRRALDVNPTIQSKLLVLEQARMNVGVAQSYFWPRVSIVASYNELQNRSEVQTYSSDDLSSKKLVPGLAADTFSLCRLRPPEQRAEIPAASGCGKKPGTGRHVWSSSPMCNCSSWPCCKPVKILLLLKSRSNASGNSWRLPRRS